jgi:hypothetical protein
MKIFHCILRILSLFAKALRFGGFVFTRGSNRANPFIAQSGSGRIVILYAPTIWMLGKNNLAGFGVCR